MPDISASDVTVFHDSPAGSVFDPWAAQDAPAKGDSFPGVSQFAPWARVIDEIRKTGTSRSGSMKLYAYILDTECLRTGTDQLRIVIPSDDLLKKKVLSQTDSIGMIESAALQVTGSFWNVRIVDSREALALKAGPTAGKSVESGTMTDDTHTPGSGDAALDRLLVFGRERGIPITIRDE